MASDDALLPRDRLVLRNDEPDQLVAASILQIDHGRSILCHSIPEQTPDANRPCILDEMRYKVPAAHGDARIYKQI
jgi:hypothetical protein